MNKPLDVVINFTVEAGNADSGITLNKRMYAFIGKAGRVNGRVL